MGDRKGQNQTQHYKMGEISREEGAKRGHIKTINFSEGGALHHSY